MDWYSEIFVYSMLLVTFLGMIVAICAYPPVKHNPQQTRLAPIKLPTHTKRRHR